MDDVKLKQNYKLPCRRLRKAEVMKMVKTFKNTSSSNMARIDPDGLHATIIIV